MTRHDLLKAHVHQAWAVRRTPESREACERILDGWTLWPAMVAAQRLERARAERELIVWACGWVRDSYGVPVEVAA